MTTEKVLPQGAVSPTSEVSPKGSATSSSDSPAPSTAKPKAKTAARKKSTSKSVTAAKAVADTAPATAENAPPPADTTEKRPARPRRTTRKATASKDTASKATASKDTASAATASADAPVQETAPAAANDTALPPADAAATPKAKTAARKPARPRSQKAAATAKSPATDSTESPAATEAASEVQPPRKSTSSTRGRKPRATTAKQTQTQTATGAQAEIQPQDPVQDKVQDKAQAKAPDKVQDKVQPAATDTASAAAPDNAGQAATRAETQSETQAATSRPARKTTSRARSKSKAAAAKTAAQADAAVTESAVAEAGSTQAHSTENATTHAPATEAAAPAVPADKSTDSADSTASEAEAKGDESEESPRRKSRRGRRGGRGRNRKSKSAEALTAAEDTASPAAEDGEAAPEADDDSLAAQADTEAQGRSKETSPAGKQAKQAAPKAKAGKKRMFISVLPGEQVEVAVAEEGCMQEYYLDMLHQRKFKGNIYKGVIHNIDTNLQAAFVSYGTGKNGFLQIDEVHPEYWLTHFEPAKGKKFPPIQKVLKAGQEVLVQVVKEPTGNKGAFLTTWLSLAGRFLVLTPGQEQIGVSRKVDSEEERSRLREMMNGIDPGQGLGVIVRTVSAGTTKTTLKNDLQYLKRQWRDIRKKATELPAPSLIYQEPGLSERAVRDYLTDDVCEIWVDHEEEARNVRETVSLLSPRKKDLVRMHTDVRQSMWDRFNLRRQMEQIYAREVLLPSGGRLVFDQTEALMAIDINSGKISGKGNFEAMAFKTNMEAAETIARQLKLRDVGGQVVIDFIEMRDKKHVLEVEKTLRQAMKNDRARHDVARMSSFGLLELVRQRMGSSALAISMEPCPCCNGTGQRRNLEWQALQCLRELRRLLRTCTTEKYVYETSGELGMYLLNHKRDSLREMEQDFGKCLEIAIKA